MEYADMEAYSEYKENLRDNTACIDMFSIGMLSDQFNRDIYFIDAKNRLPYPMGGMGNIKKRKSIIVLWVGDVHYEIIGRLLEGNKVQREFEPRDYLIRRIHTFLASPMEAREIYPELAPFIPRRGEVGGESHSETETESESESDSDSESQSESESESESEEEVKHRSRKHDERKSKSELSKPVVKSQPVVSKSEVKSQSKLEDKKEVSQSRPAIESKPELKSRSTIESKPEVKSELKKK
jgi:hypothetical protein